MPVKQVANIGEWRALLAGSSYVIVDFSAEWCGPCKMIGPVFHKLAESNPTVTFVTVDVDEAEDVAAECGISAMPTFQVFKDGNKVDMLMGANPDKLKELVKKYAEAPVPA